MLFGHSSLRIQPPLRAPAAGYGHLSVSVIRRRVMELGSAIVESESNEVSLAACFRIMCCLT